MYTMFFIPHIHNILRRYWPHEATVSYALACFLRSLAWETARQVVKEKLSTLPRAEDLWGFFQDPWVVDGDRWLYISYKLVSNKWCFSGCQLWLVMCARRTLSALNPTSKWPINCAKSMIYPASHLKLSFLSVGATEMLPVCESIIIKHDSFPSSTSASPAVVKQ